MKWTADSFSLVSGITEGIKQDQGSPISISFFGRRDGLPPPLDGFSSSCCSFSLERTKNKTICLLVGQIVISLLWSLHLHLPFCSHLFAYGSMKGLRGASSKLLFDEMGAARCSPMHPSEDSKDLVLHDKHKKWSFYARWSPAVQDKIASHYSVAETDWNPVQKYILVHLKWWCCSSLAGYLVAHSYFSVYQWGGIL